MHYVAGEAASSTQREFGIQYRIYSQENLRRLSRLVGKKHASLDDVLSDTGKVRRLAKLFEKNKIQPSPVATRNPDKISKSLPIERRFSARKSRHYSESDSLLRTALCNSALNVSKSPSSPIPRTPTVKLFANETSQWEMDL